MVTLAYDATVMLPAPGTYALPSRVSADQTRASQTLKLNLSGARIDNLTISGVDLGKATGLTNVLELSSPTAAKSQFDSVTIDGLVCPSFTLSDSNIGNLVITNNTADGNSFTVTFGTPTSPVIGSSRGRATVPAITTSTYDRLILDNGTSGGDVTTLNLTNIKAFGGACVVKHVAAGTVTLTNMTIGDGTGINTPSFTVASTVTVGTFQSTGNVEKSVTVR